MKKSIIISLSICVLIGCNSKSDKKNKETRSDAHKIIKTITKKEQDSLVKDVVKKVTPKEIGKLYAYDDNVTVYTKPNDSSEVAGILNYLDQVSRIELFASDNGEIVNWVSEWHGVFYKNDTAWINDDSEISSSLDIDTINNLILKKYYGHHEIGGYGCHYKTKAINRLTSKLIMEKYLNIDTLHTINEDRFILIPYGEVYDYDLCLDSIMYHEIGKSSKLSSDHKSMYFLRHGTSNSWDIPIELVKYDFNTCKDSILYKEPDASTHQCIIYPDGEDCTEIVFYRNDSIESISFSVYKEKENPIDEGDVLEFEVKVDINGKLISRKEK